MACIEILTDTGDETMSCGRMLGEILLPGDVVCFFGDLAAGKTTFIKGLVASIAGQDWEERVSSPTFVYLNMYEGLKTIYHFDLYRLKGIEEFLAMGFDEFFTAQGICCIEWAEKLSTLLPASCIRVAIKHEGETRRRITITL